MFGITVVTPPAVEPLTLQEAQQHLRFYLDHEDDLIRSLIIAARMYCETFTGKAFITQELRLTRDSFPRNGCEIRLPRPPLQTITPDATYTDLGFTYTDANGVEQDVDSSIYVVDPTPEVGRIGLAYGETWPTDAIHQIGAVKVQYLAGYGDPADVPDTIKAAMKLLIGHWFVNREAVGNVGGAVQMAVNSLLGTAWTGQLTADFG
jgi:uncharacterized phiE125 gp8 family phage protein